MTGWKSEDEGQECMICADTYKAGRPSVVRTGIEPCVTEGWLEDDRQAADGRFVVRKVMRHGVVAASCGFGNSWRAKQVRGYMGMRRLGMRG